MKSNYLKSRFYLIILLPLSGILLSIAPIDLSSAEDCIVSPAALSDIRDQKAKLIEKERALESRTQEIVERETHLNEEMKKLEELRKEINASANLIDQKNEEKIARIVETLGNMSAKKAAKIVENLDDKISVAALSRLDTDKLAKVMGSMSPIVSARLTELMTLGKSKISRKEALSTESGGA
jgi:flagellar motility protein MotE (MotC chaperone)